MKASEPLVVNDDHSIPPSPMSKSDDEDIPVSFRAVLQYPIYRRYLFYFLVLFIAFYERASFIAGYGAAYFGGCHSIHQNNDCHRTFDYDKFNLLYQLSTSIEGAFALFTAPIIGSLSDRYGRKPFFIFQLITFFIPNVPMILYNNMYLYLVLFTIVGLNGSTQIHSPVSQAFIAEILPQRLHIIGFALLYWLCGLGLLIGEIIGYFVSSMVNDHFNFYVITGCYVLCAVYLLFVIPETKKKKVGDAINGIDGIDETKLNHQIIEGIDSTEFVNHPNRSQKNEKSNCCSSLKLCRSNPIVFWCSLLNGLISLPALGLVDIAMVILADTFNAESTDSFNGVALYYLSGWSFGLMFGPIFVLPPLRRCFNEFGVFVANICILIIGIMAFMAVFVFRVDWTIPIPSFILGIGILSLSTLQAILSKYTNPKEQGGAFGPMYAVGNVMSTVAPFGFAVMYHYLKEMGVPVLIFVVTLFLLVLCLFASIGLKRAIDRIESQKCEKYMRVNFLRIKE